MLLSEEIKEDMKNFWLNNDTFDLRYIKNFLLEYIKKLEKFKHT